MKAKQWVFIFLLLPAVMWAQEKETQSTVKKVSVFKNGAQISRVSDKVYLNAGREVLVFRGLEQSLQEQSLRVGINGEAKILNVVRMVDYLQQQENSDLLQSLEVKRRVKQEELEDIQMQKKVYEQERSLLQSNMKLGGEQTGVDVAQLKEAAIYFRSRLMEVEKFILGKQREMQKVTEEIRKIDAQLSETNYKKNRPSTKVEVTLEVEKAGNVALLIDYMVNQASWYPSYDIRIDEVGDPVQMIRKARVTQNTGVDWKDVLLSFSTGNPMESQSLPVLYPWSLDFVYASQPIRIRGMATKSARAQPSSMAVASELAYNPDNEMAYDMGSGAAAFSQSSKNSIQEFTLHTKVDILTDGQEYVFEVGAEELQAEYHYQSVPKMEKAAYLVGTISDWEGYELIDGEASIYYENMYIGETYLSASMTLDSMILSMGKDHGIIVERKVVKDFTRSRTIGANKKKSFAYEIVLRNTKKIAIDLIVEDQIPISANSQISIETDDVGKGKVDESSGKVSWELKLDAGETVKLPLKYSVKYPKDQKVNL